MDERDRPDLDGVRRTLEQVGRLPVPRSVRAQKGEKLDPAAGAPIDEGLVPSRARPRTSETAREAEASFRRAIPRAAKTPEELGRALGQMGSKPGRK